MMKNKLWYGIVIGMAIIMLAGCNKSYDQMPKEGWTTAEVSKGQVSFPVTWEAKDGNESDNNQKSFLIKEKGEIVGQLDIISESASPGFTAEVEHEGIIANAQLSFPSMKKENSEKTKVEGADEGWSYEFTYLANGKEPARSIERLGYVDNDDNSHYLLVRITSKEASFDNKLFNEVLDTIKVKK